MPHTDADPAATKPSSLTNNTHRSDSSESSRGAGSGAFDGDGCLKSYLAEIAKTKLLTLEQETALATRIQQGDDQAREEMIKANLRLVVKIARDYEHLGLPLMDMISEGSIGLMKAVDRFDPTRGAKLSTYASWWIKQGIKRALANQSKTIRLPVHMVEKISHLRRAENHLHEELGRNPTDEELGEKLGMTAGRVAQTRAASIRPASLDAEVGGDDSNTFGDIIEDERAEAPFLGLESRVLRQIMHEMVATLSARERQILNARFGLDGSAPQTLEEVGLTLGVTRERVRQIQDKCLRKLREQMKKMDLQGQPALLREEERVAA